ncbi:OpgC domain-containing protein [Sandarakinorhabdus sp. DWP1-3-1]|uniref:OpgC domain-containing protein n=1 Tax=Sandarakinorhabdus sp. DWP1-3-1 TaxID=2804627 RepID=UPI003CE84FC8
MASGEAGLAAALAPAGVEVARTAGLQGGSVRLHRLDGLRGYLLSMMYLVHFTAMGQVFGTDFVLARLHHSVLLPVFDAEYLVPLSGFVAALAYIGHYRSQGFGGAQRVVLRRVRALYGYQVVTCLAVLLLPIIAFGRAGMPVDAAGVPVLWQSIGAAFTFVYQPGNLQILILFMGAMLFIPSAIRLLDGFGPIVFIAVLVDAWLIADAGFDTAMGDWIMASIVPWRDYIRISGAFNLLSWGAFFYFGFTIGWLYKTPPASLLAMDGKLMDRLLVACLLVCAFFYLGRVLDSASMLDNDSLFYPARDLLSVQAVLCVAATSYTIFYLFIRSDRSGRYPTLVQCLDAVCKAPWLVLLGRNSLFVYSAHVIIVAALACFLTPVHRPVGQGTLLALCALGYAVLLALAAAKQRWLAKLP